MLTENVCCTTNINKSSNKKKSDDIMAPKVDKNNWVKTMENIVMYLKLMRHMKGTLLAYVVWRHVKVTHIPLDLVLT